MVVTGSVNVIDAVAARIADAEKDGRVIEIGDDSPRRPARTTTRVLGRRPSYREAEREAGCGAGAPAPSPRRARGPGRAAARPGPSARAAAPGRALPPPPAGRSCTCGVPAVRRTAQTDRNFGRVFYACRYGRDAGCGYFDWEDGGANTLPPGSGGGLDMGRLQLLATLHARGALSDADYVRAMSLEFQGLR